MKKITIQDLMETGVHFGHQVKRWNPKMKPYIYTSFNGSHIIDLDKTLEHLNIAIEFLKKSKKEGKKILFLGTKKQIQDIVKEVALKNNDYYINHKWPGGFLTNFSTITLSLNKLSEYEKILEKDDENRTKFELTKVLKEKERLDRLYQGVRDLKGKPDIIFIVDIKYEQVALMEALKLHIPIVALVDTNTDPSLIDYPIPANDDGIKSVSLILNYIADNIK
ncbi:30S ribosomal protein S2 [Patescibacteria group bacterium]|nr:30S ribosomal protein S2 [Patescibacteria group bacterium]